MRMKGKKVLSVLLALCLLLSMAPAAVLADGPTPLTGEETVLDLSRLTGENAGDLGAPDGKWYYDAARHYIGIYGKDDHGVFTITGEPDPGIALRNIEAGDGIDLIFDRAELTLAGGSGWALNVGASNGTMGGSLTLRDSNLTVDGRGYTYTVRTGRTGGGDIPANVVDVILERSTLTATGEGDAAVYVSGGLTVKKGSTLTANQAGAGSYPADIRVQGDMVVDGGTVFTSSGKNRNYGIYVQAGRDLTVINGGAVTVYPSATGLYGIYVWEGDMRVEGGSRVSVTEMVAGSGGINLYGGGLSVEDSSLEASGDGYGISLEDALSVKNGDVTAQGTGLTGKGLSGGLGSSIDGQSEVTLAGGSNGYALSGPAWGSMEGNNDFIVNGGTVKLEGDVSWSGFDERKLVINGGSVEISGSNYPRPQNAAGTPLLLYKTALTLDGAGAGMTVSGSVTTTPSAITYNLAGAKTDGDGKVYVWLPEGTATAELAAARQNYTGAWSVTTGDTAAVTLTSSGYVLNDFVSVTGGTSYGEVTADPPYAEGELVTLTAGPASPGQVFKRWQISPDVIPVRGALTTPVIKFFMPNRMVAAEATYEDDPSLTYTAGLSPAGVIFPAAMAGYGAQDAQTLTVRNTGTGELRAAGMSLTGSAFEKEGTVGILAPGDTAVITVRPKTGLAAGTYTGALTITMNNNVTLTAALSFTVIQGILLPVSVAGGVLGGMGGTSGSYAQGDTVTITAGAAPAGKRFKEWSITPAVTFVENTTGTSSTAKFTMPAQAVTATAEYENLPGGGDNDGGSGSSGSSSSSSGSKGYVTDSAIRTTAERVTVKLGSSATRISANQTEELIKSNQEREVRIQGSNYSITFPKGSMAGTTGEQAFDFGVEINAGAHYEEMSRLAGGSLVLAVSFKHSGPLPGEALMTFNVGPDYVGQTLYYYYYNEESGEPEYLQEAVVGEDGSVSLRQAHCSEYLLADRMLTEETAEKDAGRLFGQDRYQTAVEISKAYYSEGADTVVLARGDLAVDALPAVPLAKKNNAPLLLTPPGSLPGEVMGEIVRLGARKVMIIGGRAVVSTETETTLKGKGLEVERIFGSNRYDTAYAIAVRLGSSSGQAVLVNGDRAEVTFPDALSISSWAGYHGVPILYADSGAEGLPESTAKALSELNISRTLLIGGTAVLPSRLEGLVPEPVRYGGRDAYETNSEVIKALQPEGEEIFAATGADFADALAGAAAAAQRKGWLVLTGAPGTLKGLTADQESLLKGIENEVKAFHVFGGTAVVPEASMERIKELLGLN